jgi:hypothetical protein
VFEREATKAYKISTAALFWEAPSRSKEVEDPLYPIEFYDLYIQDETSGTGYESVDRFYASWRRQSDPLYWAKWRCKTPLPIAGTHLLQGLPEIRVDVELGTTHVRITFPGDASIVDRMMEPFEAEWHRHQKEQRQFQKANAPALAPSTQPPVPARTMRGWGALSTVGKWLAGVATGVLITVIGGAILYGLGWVTL